MTAEQTNIHVLFVDDESEFLESTAKALRKRLFDVTTATSAIEALSACRERAFDVAILDVKMPDIDGHRLFYPLHNSMPSMQIIMLTGHGDFKKAFELGKNGLYAYLEKPIEIDLLAHTLKEAFNSHLKNTPTVKRLKTPTWIYSDISVLLVDDETEFLESMKKVLSRRGMEIFTAENGHAALQLMDNQAIDVALIDIKMPGIDGVELLERIKQAHPLIEVILLTGHARISTSITGMKRGAFDYLTKPQEPDELTLIIQKAYKKKRKAEEEHQQAIIKTLLEQNPD